MKITYTGFLVSSNRVEVLSKCMDSEAGLLGLSPEAFGKRPGTQNSAVEVSARVLWLYNCYLTPNTMFLFFPPTSICNLLKTNKSSITSHSFHLYNAPGIVGYI
jgi:hypothetical protein